VTSCLGKGRVQLKNLQSGKELKNRYHTANIKLYQCSDSNEQQNIMVLSERQKELLLCFIDGEVLKEVEKGVLLIQEKHVECRPERVTGKVLTFFYLF